jgi:hypothetical protein
VKVITPSRGILGLLFPPNVSKLGTVPHHCLTLYFIDAGVLIDYAAEAKEQDVARAAKEWDGSRWVPAYSFKEPMKNRNQNSKNGILTYGNL